MDYIQQLQQHLDMLFAEAPVGRPAIELKEELFANSSDRFADLVAGGMDEEAAYNTVIANIGNVDELIAALPKPVEQAGYAAWNEDRRQTRALITAASVGLYIIAAVVAVFGQFFFDWIYCLLAGIGIAIIPTCLLVYNGIANKPYEKQGDTLVENFKQFSSNKSRMKAIRGSVSTILWCGCLVFYFLISFGTGAWHITWIIFLIAVCIEAALELLFSFGGKK